MNWIVYQSFYSITNVPSILGSQITGLAVCATVSVCGGVPQCVRISVPYYVPKVFFTLNGVSADHLISSVYTATHLLLAVFPCLCSALSTFLEHC